MTRRLFFLFPGRRHAETALHELEEAGVARTHIHAVARPGIELGELPRASRAQAEDRVHRLERTAWLANQALFWSAFAVAAWAAYSGAMGWLAAMVAVMIVAYVAGLLDTRLPTTRIGQMDGAINHGEIVMMVDQPAGRVRELERMIQRRHPEATMGGVGWTIEALE